MYDGYNDKRFPPNDPNHLMAPQRESNSTERRLLTMLWQRECEMRDFITTLPGDVGQRSKATALTKLDELVMWAKRAIDS